MKQLIKKDLKSGYKLEVLLDDDHHLSVKLNNKDDEHVGQLFASDSNIGITVGRMSNGEIDLTTEETKVILEALKKSKSESLINLRRDLMTK